MIIKSRILLLSLLIPFSVVGSTVTEELNAFGNALEFHSRDQIKFIKVKEGRSNSFSMLFETEDGSLMLNGNSKKANVSVLNTAKKEQWKMKFCNVSLGSIYKEHKVRVISSKLLNSKGEEVNSTICWRSSLYGAPYIAGKENNEKHIVGTWYDDVNSPKFFDSFLKIYRSGYKYFLERTNGDGSGNTFTLEKEGNKYVKKYDKFGAYYIVTHYGLEIYDDKGFIRKARRR